MKKILGRVWLIIAATPPALFFLITYPVFFVFTAHPKGYALAHQYRRVWGWVVMFFGGIIPMVKGAKHIPKKSKVIYVMNHSSYLDIVSATCFLPGINIFLAKKELASVPLFGRWFRTIDIAVHRQSSVGSHKAFIEASKRMQEMHCGLIIFPEGTIPSHAPHLAKFKIGAFRLAIELGVKLVPVTLPDNHKRLTDGQWTASPGRMRIHIHRAIPTESLKVEDAEELRERVFAIIEKDLQHSIPHYHENN